MKNRNLMSDRKWIINIRGYANIIPSPGDVVYGFIFELTPEDRRALDKYEGVEYERKSILIDLIDVTDLHAGSGKKLNSLVYVDVERLSESHPKKEYIHRMNMAIDDALKEGVPNDYIDRYLRPFIPAPVN